MAKFSIESIFKAVDKVTAPVKMMAKATKTFGKTTADAMKRATLSTNKYSMANSGMMKNLATLVGAGGLLFMLSSGLNTVAAANIQVDESLASLQAITGVTNDEFKSFTAQVGEVSKAQIMFAGDTAKAFEVVASAQPELLKNADALGEVTNAAITLSKASGDDLTTSAQSLTSVMNQFNLAAEHSERVMNTLAAGSVAGSANITNVAASMKNFGAVASGANISVEKAVALVEVMGTKSIFAEDAGNKLKAAIINLQKAGVGYSSGVFNINDALEDMRQKTALASNEQERNNILLDTFGKTGILTGQILLNNIGKFEELTGAVTGTNTATDQMNTKSNTLTNRLAEISAAFKNATTSTDSQNQSMQGLKDLLALVANNMDKIIAVAIVAGKVFIAWGVYILAVNAALKITAALMAVGKFMRFVKIINMMVKAKGAWAAIQWALNAAMTANPFGVIIVAIGALIGIIVLLVKNWKTVWNWLDKIFDNKWVQLIGMIFMPMITIPILIAKNWEKVKVVLATVWEALKSGIKSVGLFIFDFLLFPLQQVLALAANLGSDMAQKALDSIGDVRVAMGGDEGEDDRSEVINSDAVFKQQLVQQNESNVNLSINNNNDSDIGVQTAGAGIRINKTGMF